MAALLHASATQKAQYELDKVVGRGRLPTFDDEPALPYVHNFILELMRWRPVLPLGVPHSVTRDDHFQGARIPAGTTVYGNIEYVYHSKTFALG